MERLIKDNDQAVKKVFSDEKLFMASFFVGPAVLTIVTLLNMSLLKVPLRKIIFVTLIGLLLCGVYIYSFKYGMGFALFVALGLGAFHYSIYKRLAKYEILLVDYFLGDNVEAINIFPLFFLATFIHSGIRVFMGG